MQIQRNPNMWSEAFAATQPNLQKHWLERPNALTSGLRQLGNLKLSVLSEHPSYLHSSDAKLVELPSNAQIWVREIKMSLDGIDCVVARSFTPLDASTGVWAGIRSLQQRPLADILYNDDSIFRSKFYACRLNEHLPLMKTISQHVIQDESRKANLLARCSVFWREHQPLLVAECFMPEFWQIAKFC